MSNEVKHILYVFWLFEYTHEFPEQVFCPYFNFILTFSYKLAKILYIWWIQVFCQIPQISSPTLQHAFFSLLKKVLNMFWFIKVLKLFMVIFPSCLRNFCLLQSPEDIFLFSSEYFVVLPFSIRYAMSTALILVCGMNFGSRSNFFQNGYPIDTSTFILKILPALQWHLCQSIHTCVWLLSFLSKYKAQVNWEV